MVYKQVFRKISRFHMSQLWTIIIFLIKNNIFHFHGGKRTDLLELLHFHGRLCKKTTNH